jgi:hypothetical protein
MNKVLAALALALAGSSIALASPALADDPPPVPVTPGPHTMTLTSSGKAFAVTVALDCGPACFSWADNTTRDEFHWVGDKWLDPNQGMSTVDGITFTNRNGRTGIMS